jgi:hypothetical protein
VSAATPKHGFFENRYEEAARAAASTRVVDGTLAVQHSAENDWASTSVTGTVGRDLARKNARVDLAYGHVANLVGRAHDPTFREHMNVDSAELGFTQLVDARTYLGVAYTFEREDGCLSSPYRYVIVGAAAFPEAHPKLRDRHAVTLRLLRAIGHASLDADYRLYVDDWGVLAHTAQAALRLGPGAWDIRLRARGYYQSHAKFWQEEYAMPMRYMSVDRELSNFWDASAGVKVARRFGNWIADVKVDSIYYSFIDFARLKGRLAVVSEIGIGYAW